MKKKANNKTPKKKGRGRGRRLGAAALGAAALMSAGCATVGKSNYLRTLGVSNPSMVQFLPNDYVTTRTGVTHLRTAAGIAAGTVDVKKTADGYTASGSFSEALYPDIMKKVCDAADGNGDRAITNAEARELLMDMYKHVTE